MGHELEPMRTESGPASPRRDTGFSLTEVIVAVALMGLIVVPVMLAAGLSIRTSSQSRTLTRVETVLANAADRVNRAPNGCDYAIYVQAAALAEGWASNQATVSYQHYAPAPAASTPGTWTAGACVNGVRTAGLVQMVTIGITSTDGKTLRTIQVVKSDV